ncbi:MAG: ferritin-like domain-containing protein [Bacteroidetes bacterium]|nr:ferritin-like domain-containing protein [Bacteroidota bacterium]
MDRRNFLKLSGTGTLGAGLLLAGCDILETDSRAADPSGDINLLKKVVEMEGVAVATYQFAAASGVLSTPVVIETAVAFMDSHRTHAVYINNVLQSLGGATVNWESVQKDPRAAGVSSESQVVSLATILEYEAAKAYFEHMFNSVLSTREAKKALADIYPIEAAHYLKYRELQGLSGITSTDLFTALGSP